MVFSVGVGLFSISQTGPGGVGNSATNPYWIDVHTSGGTNGGFADLIKDYSGNSADAIQSDPSLQPVFVTNAINGVSALKFDGTDCMTSGAISALNNNQYLDYYLFSNVTNTSVLSIPLNLDYGASGWQDAYTGFITLSGSNQVYGRNNIGALVRTSFGAMSGYNLMRGTFINSTNRLNAGLNFSQVSVINTATGNTPAVNEGVWLGGNPSLYKMHGFISEAFVFNKVLNTAENKIVKNYISAKFGTVITNDMYDYQATHQFGVIGIGRDNASNRHLSSQGNGIVRMTSAGLTNGKYLFVGHDGVDLSVLATDVPASMTDAVRFERVWRADEPSEIGVITLVFDLDASTDFSGDPNNYRLLIDHTDAANDDFLTVDLMVSGTYNAGTNEITFSNVDLQAGTFFTLAGDAPQDIISVNSGPWTTPETWNCTCIPTPFDNVTVDASDNVTLDADVNIEDFTINPTGTLTWNSNENIEIKGNLIISGNIVMGTDGQLTMIGSDAQTIDLASNAVDFQNLLIDNSNGGVSLLNGTIQMNSTLSLHNGAFDVSAGSLIINSTSAITSGRIGTISSNSSVLGSVLVKRFLPAGVAGERNISSPVIGATLAQWDADIEISGEGFPDGCAYGPDGCYYSVKQFISNDYQDVTDINHPLVNGMGYEVFVGTDLNTFNGATLNSLGTIRPFNDYTINVPSNDWTIMGNPYASPINFNDIEKHTNIGNYFYIYDALAGSYVWYDGSDNSTNSGNLTDGIISIGQGFWVFNNNANTPKHLIFKQSSKTLGNGNFVRNSEMQDEIVLSLTEEGTTYKCISTVGFHDEADNGFDTLDIKHLTTGLEKASSIVFESEDIYLRKQYLTNDNLDKVLNLSIEILTNGYFNISASDLSGIKERYRNVLLVDNQTNDVVNLTNGDSYYFYADKGNFDRFKLILSNREIIENNIVPVLEEQILEEVTITQIGNAINVETESEVEENSIITITNLLGQEVIYSENIILINGSNIVTLPSGFNGVYLVTVISNDGNRVTKKIIL